MSLLPLRNIRITLVLALVTIATGAAGQDRHFGGYECTDDCSGHAAGYRWAEENSITDPSRCPLRGNRVSFYEGCLAYTEDPSRGADEDDEGDDIE